MASQYADFVEGLSVCDDRTGEGYFVEGVQVCEDQAAAPPSGNPWYYYAQQAA